MRYGLWMIVLGLFGAVLLTGCSKDDDQGSGGPPLGPSAALVFSFQNADLLINMKDAVAVVPGARGTRQAPGSYRFLQDDPAFPAGDTPPVMTNLLAFDDEGNVWPAVYGQGLDFDVELAVLSPDRRFMYVVLGAISMETVEILEDCRFFQVPLDAEEGVAPYTCVSRDWVPAFSYTPEWGERLAGERQSIHFDEEGRLFFLGTGFGGSALLRLEPWETGDEVAPDNYPPDLVTPLGLLVRLTDTAQVPHDFLVTPKGTPVWYGASQAGGGAFLKAGLPGGGEVTLVSSGVRFYATDTYDSILWVQGAHDGGNCPGIRFARLREAGGFDHRCYATERFAHDTHDVIIPDRPIQLSLADDGFYYALIEGSFFRVLPANPEPVVKRSQRDQKLFLSQGSYQIAQGHVFVIDEVDDPNFGIRNELRAVDLNTRDERVLFAERRLEIYRFKVVGNTMFVVGRDLDAQAALVADVDVAGFLAGRPESEVLSASLVHDAAWEADSVREMTILRPATAVPDAEEASAPARVWFDADEFQTASLQFPGLPQEATVEQALGVGDGVGGDMSYFPVWGYRSLHLLLGTVDSVTRIGHLTGGEVFPYALDTGAVDRWGNALAPLSGAFRPRPEHGFSLRPAAAQPFGYPASLRYTFWNPLFGPDENHLRFWTGPFPAGMAQDVAGLEVVADVRVDVPSLVAEYGAGYPHPDWMGFAFRLHFPTWAACDDQEPPLDCAGWGWPVETVLGLGGADGVASYWAEGDMGSMQYGVGSSDEGLYPREWVTLRARRHARSLVVERYEDPAAPQVVYATHAAMDTADRRDAVFFSIKAGAMVEFRRIEVWPLDEAGHRLGIAPVLQFTADTAVSLENADRLWGAPLREALGILTE